MEACTLAYQLHQEGARQYLTLPALSGYAGLRHLFTTRYGGVSSGCTASWNFGAWSLDSEANILRNYEILAETLGVAPNRLVRTDQTHTTNIRVVTEADAGKGITRPRDYSDVDGLVTDVKGIVLVTGHADCNALYFYDPVKAVIGLAHSGWRGTLNGIGAAMVETMRMQYGCNPADLVAGLGPALCQTCFEVDPDVAQRFFKKDPAYAQFAVQKGIKYHIDLKQVIRYDLLSAGVLAAQFHDMGLCTKCRKDLFFSHRGHQGKRGIMAAAMMLVE